MGAPVDGFIAQDAHGVISGWSAESEQLFGWSRAEAIGMPSHRLIPERNRATHDQTLEIFIARPDQPIKRMKGDKERCLAAGMDGYLSKPIEQRSLYAVVEE